MESPCVLDKKKSHGVQLLIRTVVTDPKGKVISDSGQKKARSFIIQFLEFLYAHFWCIATDYDATDVAGNENTIWIGNQSTYRQFNIGALVNDSLYGIVVGTGNTPADNEDNKLETQLTEGTGLGNITHGAMDVTDTPSVVGANVDWEILRSFPNNTGSTITIREAGIYVNAFPAYYHCVIRDVLGIPVVLPDKCALTVYYTLRTTV